MPYKPKKPCAHHGCGELTATRYCDKHTKQEAKRYNKYDRDPASNKRYGTQWRKIRARYIAANPLCELCKQSGKLTPTDTVHHKHKLADGGSNDWENLQALCGNCHTQLHAEQGDRWG